MGTPIELTAAAAEDPALEERLRAEPAASRARLIAEADRLRTGGEPQQRLAAVVYRALHADIDPSAPDGSARAAWFVANLRWLHPDAAPLVRQAADCCADPEARLRARILAARYAEGAGDLSGADRLLQGVVDEVRGTGSTIEVTALFHTARVAANHEDAPRALAYTTRALTLGTGDLPPRWLVVVRRCRADTLVGMRDVVRSEREFVAAESAIHRLARAEGRIHRAKIAASRGRAALSRGEPERALQLLSQALDPSGEPSPHRVRWVHLMAAQAFLDLGRTGDAAQQVARAMRGGLADDRLEIELELLQIRIQRAAGGAASARPRASTLLQRLGTTGRRTIGPDRRARIAADLARVLAEQDAAAARRAFDLAATSIVEAISRLGTDTSRCPELGSLTPDDLDALRESHDRAASAHAEIEKSVARFLEAAVRKQGPEFLHGALSSTGGRLVSCAWCGRIRGGDGTWLPISHYLPSEDVLDLTHGVCGTCSEPLMRSL